MSADTESTWFRRYARSAAPRRRLVVLPHAGGTAGYFHAWGQGFDPSTEVLVTRYPGRQDRIGDPFIEAMEPLADAVTGALLPFLDVPVALFGHSMGASLAYEVALRLENVHGIRPDALYVSCRKAPHRVTPGSLDLDDPRVVAEEVRRLGGTDTALLADPDLRELVLPAIRADFRIVQGYGPRAPLPVNCPITAYLGAGDPGVCEADMRAWSDVTTRDFDLSVFPGGHFYLADQRPQVISDLMRRMG